MTSSLITLEKIGAVVIGRNEGERLRSCLESLISTINRIVYVDSGSTDGSVMLAEQLNIKVLALDMSRPFTAARARNAGFKTLISSWPELEYIQFIDGDCQLNPGWLAAGAHYLEMNTGTAVVFGRLRERFPQNSIYNMLCDLEWDVPSGSSASCGGIALIRTRAFLEINGFRETLIAGEEPEMCFRLREKGWKIYRLEAEMARHDAAMLHFNQWWKRTQRGGFAYAEGSFLHGKSAEKYWVKETRSLLVWGGLLPLVVLLAGMVVSPWYLLLGTGMYGLQSFKIALFKRKQTGSWKKALAYGFFVMAGKIPQFIGALRFYMTQFWSGRIKLIEYK